MDQLKTVMESLLASSLSLLLLASSPLTVQFWVSLFYSVLSSSLPLPLSSSH